MLRNVFIILSNVAALYVNHLKLKVSLIGHWDSLFLCPITSKVDMKPLRCMGWLLTCSPKGRILHRGQIQIIICYQQWENALLYGIIHSISRPLADRPYSGTTVLKEVVGWCGDLSKPELIHAQRLRTYLATNCQEGICFSTTLWNRKSVIGCAGCTSRRFARVLIYLWSSWIITPKCRAEAGVKYLMRYDTLWW